MSLAPATSGPCSTALGKFLLPPVVLWFVYFYDPGGLSHSTNRRTIVGCRLLDDYVVNFCGEREKDGERQREREGEMRGDRVRERGKEGETEVKMGIV